MSRYDPLINGYIAIVEFACTENDPISTFLITQEQCDRWCECEPPEGYHYFKTIAEYHIDNLTEETLSVLTKFYELSKE
jgi:hypothetical protein